MTGAVDIIKGKGYFRKVKVLFDHPNPFLLAHGGFQIQIEQTKKALEAAGVEVEWLRWWDDGQKGDLIHYFNTASTNYLKLAQSKDKPVVMTTLFSKTCNRSESALCLQGWLTQLVLRVPGGEGLKRQLTWYAYNMCAHNVVGLDAERKALETIYRVPCEKISQVPLGLSDAFLNAGWGDRTGSHLICTGTITAIKRSVELARIAYAAKVPILFVGKPYHYKDPYWQEFESLVDGSLVKYHSHVSKEDEIIQLLKASRGFVLMSDYENWCLSAHEAAACGLPLLLPDKRWSRERFGGEANYFTGKFKQDIESIKDFYKHAATARRPQVKLWSWKEAVIPLISTYEHVLKTS